MVGEILNRHRLATLATLATLAAERLPLLLPCVLKANAFFSMNIYFHSNCDLLKRPHSAVVSLSMPGAGAATGPVRGDGLRHLTDLQRWVTQNKGTELPFTGEYCDVTDSGRYECVVCGR